MIFQDTPIKNHHRPLYLTSLLLLTRRPSLLKPQYVQFDVVGGGRVGGVQLTRKGGAGYNIVSSTALLST